MFYEDEAVLVLKRLLHSRMWWVAPLALAAVLLASALAYVFWPRGGSVSSGVAPRDQLTDYSWDELSAIADELAHCASQSQAISQAARYGLCATDGTLDPSAAKELVLTDGTVVRVVLVGIRHDTRTDGGSAGLTFAFDTAAGTHSMNHAFEDVEGFDADSTGGWAASDMRTWLEDSFFYELPPDVRNHIVRVQKRTANAVDLTDELFEPGKLAGTGADWVAETSDLLWLFSSSELCGSIPAFEDLGVDETMSAVYEAEGEQYRLFADAGVAAFATNEALVRADAASGSDAPCTWWLRTKTLEFGDGFWLIGNDGTPLNGLGEDIRVVENPEYAPEELWGPDHARGVVVGFCL